MMIVVSVAEDGFMLRRLRALTAMPSHDMPGGEEPAEQEHDCNGSMKKLHGPNPFANDGPTVKLGFRSGGGGGRGARKLRAQSGRHYFFFEPHAQSHSGFLHSPHVLVSYCTRAVVA